MAEHLDKLGKVKGFTGSIEREIRNFAQQINAIDDVLRRRP
ncbi:MAG: hypothetical protein WEC75_11770 [Dehalococcoidia bacterium]